ncbi:hypothetical protein ACQ4PT_037706 [Festuca glaucescens]
MDQLEFMEERQRFRPIQICNRDPPCHQDDNAHGGKIMKYSGPELPEDIWSHIHSLMLLRDAARAASVSHAFLRSWRCHPNLTFDLLNIGRAGISRGFISRVDHILKKHSGKGLKKLKLDFTNHYNTKTSSYIDSWLQMAITAGIEELSLKMFSRKGVYNFPCSFLSNEMPIGYLHLENCAIRPTVRLGSLRSLTILHLCDVSITGDELQCLLCSCGSLQRLELRKCSEITCLKLPFLLQQLSCLQVSECHQLRTIKNEAPSISSSKLCGKKLKLLLGESLRLKSLEIGRSRDVVCYAHKELPISAPNLQSLTIYSAYEKVKSIMAPSKFLHLKYLKISLCCTYDYLSLACFLDAAPSLETFILSVFIPSERVDRKSIFGDISPFQRMPGYRHGKLQRVKIARFYSEKSLVELACHILENATSLECLTLDTTGGHYRCGLTGSSKCYPMRNHMDVPKAISAIRTYIEGIIPSSVELNVVKPCSRRCGRKFT